MNDLKCALRMLLKNPGFTVVAVLTLGLGIGANTAIFQLLNTVRMKSLPIARPEQLVEVRMLTGNPGLGISDGPNSEMTYPLWEQLKKRQEPFSSLMAWGSGELPVGKGIDTRMIKNLWVSGDFFSTLGVSPVLGRLFGPDDDRRGAGPDGAVISYRFWQSEFGGMDSVIGKSLTVGDKVFQVIGVAPAGFFGLEIGKDFDVALPASLRNLWSAGILDRTDAWWLRIMGRLKPDWTTARASEFLKTVNPGILDATVPTGYGKDAGERYRKLLQISAFPASHGVSELRSRYERPLWLLLAFTGLVLLAACVNLANLMLARASARMREMAVRLAIGASRARLIRQMLVESLLLAVAGACVGAELAQGLSRSIVWFLSSQEGTLNLDLSLDWRVLAFTTTVAVLTCIAFGLVPALRSSWIEPNEALRSGGRGFTGNREHFMLQRGLAIFQIAVSLILLAGALLLVQSFRNLTTLNTGFRQDGILVAYLSFLHLQGSERQQALKTELLEKIRSVPQVESAAFTSHVPIHGGSWTMGVRTSGIPEEKEGSSKVTWISPQYFATMGIPLVIGRDVDAKDTATSPKVAVVNETFLRRFIGVHSPIGAAVRTFAEPGYPEALYQIVGVVKDTKYGSLRGEVPPEIFVPAPQHPNPGPWATVMIRSSASLSGVATAVKECIRQADPLVRLGTFPLRKQVLDGLARERLMAWLSGFFGALAAVLVAIGLYGLVSYITLMRRNELGIHLALGAQRFDILWLVLRQGLNLAVIGVTLGLGGALALTRFLSGLLFGVSPSDPWTLIAISSFLTSVAMLACWLPARRAAGADPMAALRTE